MDQCSIREAPPGFKSNKCILKYYFYSLYTNLIWHVHFSSLQACDYYQHTIEELMSHLLNCVYTPLVGFELLNLQTTYFNGAYPIFTYYTTQLARRKKYISTFSHTSNHILNKKIKPLLIYLFLLYRFKGVQVQRLQLLYPQRIFCRWS